MLYSWKLRPCSYIFILSCFQIRLSFQFWWLYMLSYDSGPGLNYFYFAYLFLKQSWSILRLKTSVWKDVRALQLEPWKHEPGIKPSGRSGWGGRIGFVGKLWISPKFSHLGEKYQFTSHGDVWLQLPFVLKGLKKSDLLEYF